MSVLVSPSVLNADFSKLEEECLSLQQSGANWLHCDVMDGIFVPNKALSAEEVAKIKNAVTIPLDVHLMVQNPKEIAQKYIESGANIITFHVESSSDIAQTANLIKNSGVKVGLSVKPNTPIETLLPYANLFDLILIMTVEPGFGGQKFLPSSLDKIRAARRLFSDKLIEVDGGINQCTAALAVEAGADVLVSGSYVIKAENRAEVIEKLKNCLD